MTGFDRRNINLKALNSLTKYPSIPTYHTLDGRGGLTEEAVEFTGDVIATEKVDGTNARIILLPDGTYMLGSRENLLYASGDLIGDPAQGIVEHLRAVAHQLPTHLNPADGDIRVFYMELYGGKIGGQAKQYSAKGAVGWRLFDVTAIDGGAEKLTWPTERISTWRDDGGQAFADEATLNWFAGDSGIQLTPRLFTTYGDALPRSVDGMARLLAERAQATRVALDDSGKGEAEGVVFRAPDRSVIAKARFQDYARTAKRRASQ